MCQESNHVRLLCYFDILGWCWTSPLKVSVHNFLAWQYSHYVSRWLTPPPAFFIWLCAICFNLIRWRNRNKFASGIQLLSDLHGMFVVKVGTYKQCGIVILCTDVANPHHLLWLLHNPSLSNQVVCLRWNCFHLFNTFRSVPQYRIVPKTATSFWRRYWFYEFRLPTPPPTFYLTSSAFGMNKVLLKSASCLFCYLWTCPLLFHNISWLFSVLLDELAPPSAIPTTVMEGNSVLLKVYLVIAQFIVIVPWNIFLEIYSNRYAPILRKIWN